MLVLLIISIAINIMFIIMFERSNTKWYDIVIGNWVNILQLLLYMKDVQKKYNILSSNEIEILDDMVARARINSHIDKDIND